MTDEPRPVPFWYIVLVLLRAAGRRGAARRRRQRELLQQAGGSGSRAIGTLALLGALLFAAVTHGVFWGVLETAVRIAQSHDPDLHGAARGLAAMTSAPPLAFRVGLAVVVLWFVMMAFQGEGLELDVTRRRYPMWEWLFSHPIPPGAAFVAEMLSPLASNPVFVAAPIFWACTLARIHAGPPGWAAGIVVGAVLAVAASCVSKTIEIAAMLRLSPRSRSAALGIMSWLGYATMIVGLFALSQQGILIALVSGVDHAPALFPSTLARWMFGITRVGGTSAALSLGTCLALAAALIVGCIAASTRVTNAGLTAESAERTTVRVPPPDARRMRIIRDPVFRKELLWFWRDRGAVVQAVLIPLTMGAMQAFNFRWVAEQAGNSWNWLCGLGLLCGTYFLLAVGPRSLKSEGGALWMSLTWPSGLESLLKAKARLWWLVGSAVVTPVFVLAAVRFPDHVLPIAVVGCGWIVFGRSLAEKTVTLVVAPSSSGEPEPVPRGRQFAVMLGVFSFTAGVIQQNWHLAALGVMFSTLTSAAMWQNFRGRLPYLFDPTSETPAAPPTLMHAMVAITAMVDGMGLVAIPFAFKLGRSGIWVAQTAAYGIAALATWIVTTIFLDIRGVPAAQIWRWPPDAPSPRRGVLARAWGTVQSTEAAAVIAVAIGLVCGLSAVGYSWGIARIPGVDEQVTAMSRHLVEHPEERIYLLVLAVGFAPIAEEYLFRGLLFRALDREWGGWRAVVGSALFFAVYHPPLAWLPVGVMGVVLASLFRASGRLWPCVLVHATYNLVVTVAL